MNKYIGVKLVEAAEASFEEAQLLKLGACKTLEEVREKFGDVASEKSGYVVRYPDGYISWSPKDVFEKAYLKVQHDPDVYSGAAIREHVVNEFISYIETSTIGNKTTLVRCVLRNGFEIIETASFVDAKNYNEKLGEKLCMEKLQNKIWYLLDFLLQTSWHGIK
jgi:hypothetical protein